MLRKLKRVIVIAVAGVMLMSSVLISNAEACSHTYDGGYNSLYKIRETCTGVSSLGIHPQNVDGEIKTCYMERRTYERVYQCWNCGETVVQNEQEIWHSISH